MPEQFLHGIEIVEVTDGIRPIRTVRSGVIGVVGTAPNSAAGVAAVLFAGNVTLKTAVQYKADAVGIAGNQITIKYTDPGDVSQALAVAVTDNAIDVSLATDVSGDITSTVAEVLAAVNADGDAGALVTASNYSTSDGSGVVVAQPARSLAGGTDEPFPLNTPVLCTNRAAASRLDPLSAHLGTLVDAMDGIYDQAGAICVVVRVEVGADDAETITNVIGGVDGTTGKFTGAHCFEGARDALGLVPRILIAPGWSQNQSVANELKQLADKLRSVALIDGPDTTDVAAMTYATLFDSPRLYLIDPWVMVRQADGSLAAKPPSARAAGLISRSDTDRGFWWSPSNQTINGIIGTSRAVSWDFNEPNTRGNLLNEARVATIIHEQGYRLWGNRTLSMDPKWTFLSVRRTADMLNQSILYGHLWAVDRNITRQYFEEVSAGVNAYIRRLQAQGALIGGRCIPNPDLNTPEAIADGKVFFDMEFTPPYPAEHITFRSALVHDYLEELIA